MILLKGEKGDDEEDDEENKEAFNSLTVSWPLLGLPKCPGGNAQLQGLPP